MLFSHYRIIVICVSMWQVQLGYTILAPLFPDVSKLDWHYNSKYLNASLQVLETEQVYNKTYVIWLVSTKELKELKLSTAYSVMSFNGAVQSKLFSRSFDLCQFFRRPTMDRLMKMFYDSIKLTSILPTSCPIRKGLQSMLNLVPANMPVPGFIPETDFLVEVFVYTGIRQEPMFETRWFGKLRKID